MTENKRFIGGSHGFFDRYKENRLLWSEWEDVIEIMNNLDTKARERGKALSKLQKENNELKSENQYLKSLKWNQDCINEISINMQQKQLLERQNNELIKENEQLKSLIQELRNELNFDAKQYKVFIEVIDEADDLIKSHLSEYYQRKWKNFCRNREIEV